ncbi:hypothetical protein NX059_002342 [Plenodomus lindquistii]|nr:hypothetical protein NX059_002342 [Plenodomus lindquistii]
MTAYMRQIFNPLSVICATIHAASGVGPCAVNSAETCTSILFDTPLQEGLIATHIYYRHHLFILSIFISISLGYRFPLSSPACCRQLYIRLWRFYTRVELRYSNVLVSSI